MNLGNGGERWPKRNRTMSPVQLGCWLTLVHRLDFVGGGKTGDDRWYRKFIPIADRLFEAHMDELRRDGKL